VASTNVLLYQSIGSGVDLRMPCTPAGDIMQSCRAEAKSSDGVFTERVVAYDIHLVCSWYVVCSCLY